MNKEQVAPLWRRELPLIAAAISVVSWGIGPLLIRGISAGSPTIVVLRLTISIPLMTFVALRTGGRLSIPLMRITFISGIFSFFSMAFSFESIRHTSIANQTLIGSVFPFLLLLVAPRVLKETVYPAQLIFGGIGFIGITAVILGAGSSSGASLYGDSLAAIGMVAWTMYFIIAKLKRTGGVNSWAFLAANYIWSTIFSVVWACVKGFNLGEVGPGDWVLILSMVVLQGIGAHGLHTWALKHLDASVASLLTLGCPVISTIGAYYVYGQTLSAVQILGAVLVIASMAGVSTFAQRREKVKRALIVPIL